MELIYQNHDSIGVQLFGNRGDKKDILDQILLDYFGCNIIEEGEPVIITARISNIGVVLDVAYIKVVNVYKNCLMPTVKHETKCVEWVDLLLLNKAIYAINHGVAGKMVSNLNVQV